MAVRVSARLMRPLFPDHAYMVRTPHEAERHLLDTYVERRAPERPAAWRRVLAAIGLKKPAA
ncbi:MAG: hypothetical protein QOE90_2723 [Thermoplasmata archaeon]|jgi:hypothetical protein|nr:hypothetical protein [Thermoplasmata archaeon]